VVGSGRRDNGGKGESIKAGEGGGATGEGEERWKEGLSVER